jgi:hypothetical protein
MQPKWPKLHERLNVGMPDECDLLIPLVQRDLKPWAALMAIGNRNRSKMLHAFFEADMDGDINLVADYEAFLAMEHALGRSNKLLSSSARTRLRKVFNNLATSGHAGVVITKKEEASYDG